VTTSELVVVPDDVALAARAAAWVAAMARAAVPDHGSFRFAVSGGHTPWAMFATLTATEDVPWVAVEIFQVDERVAPDGDDARNLTHLRLALAGVPAVIHPMPVNEPDLVAGAAAYARELPDRFDLVHLGLGPDGHTASLVPGDPVLNVTDTDVALTGIYQGRRRMTLTYPIINRCRTILWLVTGSDKAGPLVRLRDADPSIPAGRVRQDHALVLADRAAAAELETN
jgi:6-phosphogluconolactonase